ncbi:hypothetical protein AVEN_201671-1 [Araneus ventricosus]|uniref:Uncharacterized protein n=1 Tax=Araneus ventricosus TaxID=182803 RepID=A0A4Y2QHT6_ARAVE|nr:hypothetical protein AVEN_201671-1 [Araneus ventricosus]
MGAQLYSRYQVRLNDVEAPHLTRNEKIQSDVKKVTLAMFWEAQGEILIDFFTSGSINAARCCETLPKLKSAFDARDQGSRAAFSSFLRLCILVDRKLF